MNNNNEKYVKIYGLSFVWQKYKWFLIIENKAVG